MMDSTEEGICNALIPCLHSCARALDLQIPVFNMIIRFTPLKLLSDFMAVTPQELS